jgi:hypothetical protein
LAFPAWFAAIVQVPCATRCTVVAVGIVQIEAVRELKVTARPEEAVAETVKSGSFTAFAASAPKVIVWLALPTVKLRETCGAALKFVFPAWSALIVQVPGATIVTVLPASVQTEGSSR